jgi:hypothetical protein
MAECHSTQKKEIWETWQALRYAAQRRDLVSEMQHFQKKLRMNEIAM